MFINNKIIAALTMVLLVFYSFMPLNYAQEIISETEPEVDVEIEPERDHEYRGAMISAGLYHNALVNEKGDVYTWGDNTFGQLGTGNFERAESPTKVEGLVDVVMVSAGAYHTLALTSDGNVYAFGRNTFGQIGNNKTQAIPYPVRVEDIPPVKEISAGAYHSLMLTSDGQVYGWGNNTKGQVGNVVSEEILNDNQEIIGQRVKLPKRIPEINDAIAISAGGYHSLYINSQNDIYSWGDNEFGQLGYESQQISTNIPEQIEGVDNATSIEAGYLHNIAVTKSEVENSDILYAWGSNAAGQLGIGSLLNENNFIYQPSIVNLNEPIIGEGISISKIAAGYFNSIITIKSTSDSQRDSIFIWGNNDYGQLGIGNLPSQNIPVKMVATSNGWTTDSFLPFQSISAGGYHTAFLSVKGFLGTAGRADSGQLGIVSVINSFIPIGVPIVDAVSPRWENESAIEGTVRDSSLRIIFDFAKDNIRVSGYELRYIDEDGNPQTVDLKTETSHTITDIDVNSSQTILVFAKDEQENISFTPLKYFINSTEQESDLPTNILKRTFWSPELYGTIEPMEVPWDVDYIYGSGVVLPPMDYSWVIAILITSVVLLFFATLGIIAFKRNHKDIKIFGNIIKLRSNESKKEIVNITDKNENIKVQESEQNNEVLEIRQVEDNVNLNDNSIENIIKILKNKINNKKDK